MAFNLFDIIFVALLLIFSLISFTRGAAHELFTLLGLLGGFLVAERYAGRAAEVLGPLLPESDMAEVFTFLLIMLGGYFVGVFLGGITDHLRNKPVGELSRLTGGVIGLVKGMVACLALYWVVTHHVPPFQDELAQSWMGAWLAKLLANIQSLNVL